MHMDGRPSNFLGFFALGLHRQGPAGRRKAAPPAEGRSALEVRPEQGSILRAGTQNFGRAVSAIDYFFKIRFIMSGRLVTQAAVQPQVIVVKLDVLEEFPACLSPW